MIFYLYRTLISNRSLCLSQETLFLFLYRQKELYRQSDPKSEKDGKRPKIEEHFKIISKHRVNERLRLTWKACCLES